jgi:hypothetical protein
MRGGGAMTRRPARACATTGRRGIHREEGSRGRWRGSLGSLPGTTPDRGGADTGGDRELGAADGEAGSRRRPLAGGSRGRCRKADALAGTTRQGPSPPWRRSPAPPASAPSLHRHQPRSRSRDEEGAQR